MAMTRVALRNEGRRGWTRPPKALVGVLLLVSSAVACSLTAHLDGLADGLADADTSSAGQDATAVDGGSTVDAFADATLSERYRAAVLADGPTLYYRFDDPEGSAIANEGRGGAGLVVNPSLQFGVNGAFDGSKAISFTDAGTISAGNVLSFDGRKPFTFEFWYRPDPTNVAAYCAFFGKGLTNAAGRQSYSFWVHSTDGLAFDRYVDDVKVRTGIGNLKVDDYYHLAAAYDGTELTIYVNGAPQITTEDTREFLPIDAPFLVGTSFTSTCLRATMDEFAVYERALPPEAINAHYHAAGRQ